MDPMRPVNSCLSDRKWAGRCHFGKFVTSRPAQSSKFRLEAGREFQRCSLESFRDLRGTQNAKVVYPPPRRHEIQGVEDRAPKMGPVRPVNIGVSRSTIRKWRGFGPKIDSKPRHVRVFGGSGVQNHPQKSPFLGQTEGGCERPKSRQTPIFSGSNALFDQNWISHRSSMYAVAANFDSSSCAVTSRSETAQYSV
jgi:hypothetical protein